MVLALALVKWGRRSASRSMLCVATGRKPAVSGLSLNNAEAEFDKHDRRFAGRVSSPERVGRASHPVVVVDNGRLRQPEVRSTEPTALAGPGLRPDPGARAACPSAYTG